MLNYSTFELSIHEYMYCVYAELVYCIYMYMFYTESELYKKFFFNQLLIVLQCK